MKIIASLLCTILISSSLFAQEDLSLAQLKETYKSRNAVYLHEKEHVNIRTKGNSYEIYSDVDWSIMYLSDKGSAYGDQSISFSKFTEIEDIKAISYLPKRKPGRYKKSKVKHFETEDIFSSSYFFHDGKKISFQYPGNDEGTIISLKYREKMNEPHFLSQKFFISHLPTVHSEYSVTFPSNVDLKYKTFNTDSFPIEFTSTTNKDLTTYTWTIKNQDAFEYVDNAPNIKYFAPHVVLYIGDMRLQDTTISVLPNLDALYSWYNTLVREVNAEEDSVLKNITEKLTAGIESKDEKARAIFNWVQDNIKYVAFEDGMGGFIPRPAARVCRNRYGDCKDMASIITDMLKYANVEGSLTWIGSRDLPYDYTEIATPVVDNHMIASYRNEKDEVVFLDAVGSYTPYGYPTGFIQGKQALVRKTEDTYEIHRVPVITKEKNLSSEKLILSMEDTKLSGTGNLELLGYSKLDFVYPLISKNQEDKTTRLQEMLEKGSNKFKIKEASFEGIDNRDTNLVIKYNFTLEDYVKKAGQEFYVNFNLDRDFKNSKLDIEKRKNIAMEFDYKILDRNVVELELPNGAEVTYLPESSSYSDDLFGFSISYEVKNGKVVMTKEIYVDLLLLNADKFESWNSMIKALNKAYKDVVVINKK